jgi:hypothetical protein
MTRITLNGEYGIGLSSLRMRLYILDGLNRSGGLVFFMFQLDRYAALAKTGVFFVLTVFQILGMIFSTTRRIGTSRNVLEGK